MKIKIQQQSLGLFKYALNCPYHHILLYVGNANFESNSRFGKWSAEHWVF